MTVCTRIGIHLVTISHDDCQLFYWYFSLLSLERTTLGFLAYFAGESGCEIHFRSMAYKQKSPEKAVAKIFACFFWTEQKEKLLVLPFIFLLPII